MINYLSPVISDPIEGGNVQLLDEHYHYNSPRKRGCTLT